jgi:hypothetical protein
MNSELPTQHDILLSESASDVIAIANTSLQPAVLESAPTDSNAAMQRPTQLLSRTRKSRKVKYDDDDFTDDDDEEDDDSTVEDSEEDDVEMIDIELQKKIKAQAEEERRQLASEKLVRAKCPRCNYQLEFSISIQPMPGRPRLVQCPACTTISPIQNPDTGKLYDCHRWNPAVILDQRLRNAPIV